MKPEFPSVHFSRTLFLRQESKGCWIAIYLFLSLFPAIFLRSQTVSTDAVHKLTLFFMPSVAPLSWESPASLYKTAKRSFYKAMIHKDTYIIGHAAICLKTPLLPQGVSYLAMTAADPLERIELVLSNKIGLAILGATLKGKLEDESHTLHKLSVHARRHQLAYITFEVNEACMARMLTFIQEFSQQRPKEIHPSDYYGGAFWPLYDKEGAGCTAFALGMLASTGLLPPEAGNWLVSVAIPMSLIGGAYNGNKKVHFHDILKARKWSDNKGIPNVEYVTFRIYDPSIAYEWILNKRLQTDSTFLPVSEGGAFGLSVDLRNKSGTTQGPIFSKRPDQNRFIDVYRQKLQLNISDSAFP
ncbi:MAG: hypothetical protein Q8914_13975 [Bacteroidota bacterium]|nr:hypothetical protein [Bacteroidota bacterium]